MSATIIFDSQDYARRLEQAGFTPQQAEILKEHGEHLRAALQPLLRFYEETAHRDLATKGDVMDTRLEIERVRAEVERVRADLKVEIEKVRADLKTDIEKIRAELKTDIATVKYDLLKWQIGIALAGFGGLAAIMAKGFGWLGF